MVASTTRRQLRRCLNDIDFPASKDDLLAAADRHDCDNDTVRALRAIPAETYANATQVLASVTVTDDEIRDDQKAAARRSHTKPGRAEITKDLDTESPIVDELGENRGS